MQKELEGKRKIKDYRNYFVELISSIVVILVLENSYIT